MTSRSSGSGEEPKHAAEDDENLNLFGDAAENDSEEAEGPAAPVRPRGKRRWLRIFLAALLVAVLLVVGVLFYYFRSISGALNNIHRDPSLMPDENSVTTIAPGKPINFVLMGTDGRPGLAGSRSDSLMVAQLSGDRQHLYLVTFLRDMWVTIPANKVVNHDSKAKINAAYSWGGPALTVKTVQNLTGVTMDHVVVIDFNGFIKLTDELGGVTVYNPQASKIDGQSFAQGNITIRGEQALKYVRERYDLANGDLDRAARQRAVVTAIIDKTLSGGVLSNPTKFNQVMQTYSDTMTVDSGLTTSNIRKIATSLKFSSGKGVVQVQAPISGFGKSRDGQAYDIVDEAGMKELSSALKNDRMADYVANHPQ